MDLRVGMNAVEKRMSLFFPGVKSLFPCRLAHHFTAGRHLEPPNFGNQELKLRR
jgi:hypothetical protein